MTNSSLPVSAYSDEHIYRDVVQNLKEVVFMVDNEGRFTLLNPAWAEITGFPVATSLGRYFLDFVHEDDKANNLALFIPLMEKRKNVCQHETRYLTHDGGFRWIGVHARLVLGPDGETRGAVGTFADISERKKAEAQVLANLARERELNDMKSHFVSVASHELRTPLATLTLGLDFLISHRLKLSDEKIERTLGTIREGNQQLISIVDDLLLLGRADEGKMRFDPVSVSVPELLHKIAQDSGLTEGQRRRISISCDPQTLNAVVDPQLIRHIVLNLLSNACKYSGDECAVQLSASTDTKGLKLMVKDSGIGIPDEDKGRVFSLFFRGQNVGNISGSGLGLIVVKRCVEAHQGDIAFVSSSQNGTCFTVLLPLVSTS